MGVAGSSPGSFSRDQGVAAAAIHLLAFLAPWPSGKAEDCKSFIPGSNPGGASGNGLSVHLRGHCRARFAFLSVIPQLPP